MKSANPKYPRLAIRPQHSCFTYESDHDGVLVTVWSKHKKTMRSCEVNMWLDLAKASLLEKLRGI